VVLYVFESEVVLVAVATVDHIVFIVKGLLCLDTDAIPTNIVVTTGGSQNTVEVPETNGTVVLEHLSFFDPFVI